MIIVELHTKGLLDKMDISPQKRAELFPNPTDPKGKNKVVAIRQEGLAVLDTFNGHVNRLFDDLIHSSNLPKTLISYGLSHLPRAAQALATAAREQAKQLREQAQGPSFETASIPKR